MIVHFYVWYEYLTCTHIKSFQQWSHWEDICDVTRTFYGIWIWMLYLELDATKGLFPVCDVSLCVCEYHRYLFFFVRKLINKYFTTFIITLSYPTDFPFYVALHSYFPKWMFEKCICESLLTFHIMKSWNVEMIHGCRIYMCNPLGMLSDWYREETEVISTGLV